MAPTPKSVGLATSNAGWQSQRTTDPRACNSEEYTNLTSCELTQWAIRKSQTSGLVLVAGRQEFKTTAQANQFVASTVEKAKEVGTTLKAMAPVGGVARYSFSGTWAAETNTLLRMRLVITAKLRIVTMVEAYSLNAALPIAVTIAKVNTAALKLR